MSHPYAGHKQNAVGKRRANKLVRGNEYAEGGAVSKGPKGTVRAIPIIKDQAHLGRLLDNADSYDALRRIQRMGERQGLDTSGWGIK